MVTYYRWVLYHRVAVLIICAVITVLAGLSLSRVTMSTSLSKMFLEDTTDHQRYVERVMRYGGSEQLIIGFARPDLESAAAQNRLRRIIGQLDALDGVSRVTSLFDAMPPGGTVDLAALAADPMVGGLLLSADRRHVSIVVEFEPDDLQTLERAPAVLDTVRTIFDQEGVDSDSLHFGGFVAMLAETARQGRRNLAWITPLVAALLLLMVYGFFRRLWPVLLTALVSVVAIVWTMGFACLLDREFNVMVALVPALILLISFSDVVHLCSAYAKELAGGRDRDEAILTSAVDVGTACIMTSLTTFVGFVSLSFVEVSVIRRFGFVLGFGTAVALVLAMTVVPVIFTFMRPPRHWSHEDERRPGRIVDASLALCERLATGHPWKLIAGFLMLMAVFAVGCTRVRVEADFVARMSKGSPLRIATDYFNDHFSGTLAIELFVTAEDELAIGPELFQRLATCRAVIEEHPEVTKVIPPFGAATNLRPTAADLSRFVDIERREVRFVALIRETGVSAIYDIGQVLQQDAQTALGPGIAVEPSGFFYLAGRWLDHHIVTNKRAVLIAFSVIAVILVLLFRSIRIGLWSMLPNVLPLLAVGGVLGLVWRTVDSDLVIMLLIAMGIAVDDTIHFLSRWRIEIRRGATSTEALHRAFGFAGRAIVKTSVIFAIGFAPMALSGYLPFRMLGILMPLAVMTALLADLLLLPALIRVGAIPLNNRGSRCKSVPEKYIR